MKIVTRGDWPPEPVVQPFVLVPCFCNPKRGQGFSEYALIDIWFEFANSVDEAVAKAQSPKRDRPKHQSVSSWHMLPVVNGIYQAVSDQVSGDESEIHIANLKVGGVLFAVKNHICKHEQP